MFVANKAYPSPMYTGTLGLLQGEFQIWRINIYIYILNYIHYSTLSQHLLDGLGVLLVLQEYRTSNKQSYLYLLRFL